MARTKSSFRRQARLARRLRVLATRAGAAEAHALALKACRASPDPKTVEALYGLLCWANRPACVVVDDRYSRGVSIVGSGRRLIGFRGAVHPRGLEQAFRILLLDSALELERSGTMTARAAESFVRLGIQKVKTADGYDYVGPMIREASRFVDQQGNPVHPIEMKVREII